MKSLLRNNVRNNSVVNRNYKRALEDFLSNPNPFTLDHLQTAISKFMNEYNHQIVRNKYKVPWCIRETVGDNICLTCPMRNHGLKLNTMSGTLWICTVLEQDAVYNYMRPELVSRVPEVLYAFVLIKDLASK